MNRSMKIITQWLPVIFLYLLMIGCSPQKETLPLEEVTVQLGWHHQAQFAGFYVADQNGYYAEEGLKVNLLPRPSPTADVVSPVAAGAADFGVINSFAVINARSKGNLVTAIAAVYRIYPLVFMTHADSGIERPQDFPGHTIGPLVPGSNELVFNAVAKRVGIAPDTVRRVEPGFELAQFYNGEVDIWAGFLINEVLAARENGYSVNLIFPSDYGTHLYGDTIFTSQRLIDQRPDLVTRFLRATLKGWRWAIENPEAAGALSLEYDPSLDSSHEIAIMEASVPLIHTGEAPIGWMDPTVFQETHDRLLEQGILIEPINVDELYTLKFLQQVYGDADGKS